MGIKISELPVADLPLLGSEIIPLVQSDETKTASLSSITSSLTSLIDQSGYYASTNYVNSNFLNLSGGAING